MVNTLLYIGHRKADIWEMTYLEVNSYLKAHELEEAEKLVMQLNVLAVGFGGTAKDRQKMANTILGIDQNFDVEGFESILAGAFLADAPQTAEQEEVRKWADQEFNVDDPAFKLRK